MSIIGANDSAYQTTLSKSNASTIRYSKSAAVSATLSTTIWTTLVSTYFATFPTTFQTSVIAANPTTLKSSVETTI